MVSQRLYKLGYITDFGLEYWPKKYAALQTKLVVIPIRNAPVVENQPGLLVPPMVTNSCKNTHLLFLNETNCLFKIGKRQLLAYAEAIKDKELLKIEEADNRHIQPPISQR